MLTNVPEKLMLIKLGIWKMIFPHALPNDLERRYEIQSSILYAVVVYCICRVSSSGGGGGVGGGTLPLQTP